MTHRIHNFCAGPCTLPLTVLEEARAELTDFQGCGMSVMEMSHRGKDYMSIQAQAEADLRELLNIPSGYRVLFLAGGATLQFAALVLKKGKKASEILSEIKPYPQILLNLKITEKKPLESIAGLKELEASLAKEGIRSLFRYSGTENLIRLLIEGKCADALKTRMDEVEKFFLKALNG